MIQQCRSKGSLFPLSQVFCPQLIQYIAILQGDLTVFKTKDNESNEMGRHGHQKKAFTWTCESDTRPFAVLFCFMETNTKTHLVFWPLPPLSLAVWQVQSWSLEALQWILTDGTCALCPSPELHRLCVRSLA